MEYKWQKTTIDVYHAIYNEHKEDFGVFETYTEMDSHGDGLTAQITAWGFKGAEHPLIRSQLSCDEWIYSILKTVVEDD